MTLSNKKKIFIQVHLGILSAWFIVSVKLYTYSRFVIHLELEGVLIGVLDPGDDEGGGEGF